LRKNGFEKTALKSAGFLLGFGRDYDNCRIQIFKPAKLRYSNTKVPVEVKKKMVFKEDEEWEEGEDEEWEEEEW
jgi:hypothetical protein